MPFSLRSALPSPRDYNLNNPECTLPDDASTQVSVLVFLVNLFLQRRFLKFFLLLFLFQKHFTPSLLLQSCLGNHEQT